MHSARHDDGTRRRRLTPDTNLLSPENLEAIAPYLASEDYMTFLRALPDQLRTPALRLVAMLAHVLGSDAIWPGLDLGVLTQLANAKNILAQLLSVHPTLRATTPTALPNMPPVLAPPSRPWPMLGHLSLTFAAWAMDPAVLTTVQQVLTFNAASLRSIEVHFSAPYVREWDELKPAQNALLEMLVGLLVALQRIEKLTLRATHKLRFPDAAAASLAAWIDTTPLTSLTMNNMYELSSTQSVWAKPTLVSLALDPLFRFNHRAAFSRWLTHIDLRLFGPYQLYYVAERLIDCPLTSLHFRLEDGDTIKGGQDVQRFLETHLPSLHQLTTLRLTSVHLSTTHCLTLALLLPRYKHVALTSNKLGDAGVLALAPFLRHTSQLETLKLVGQGFGDVGASALATALKHTPLLHTLDLGRNEIKMSGVVALSHLFPYLPRLATWRLSNNPLGAKGLVFLLRAWTYVELNTTMLIDARSTIDNNDDSRDVDALIAALPRHRTCLVATETPTTEGEHQTIAYAETPILRRPVQLAILMAPQQVLDENEDM
ncbi:hypothetical protein SDRG_09720 [Saprolegnia diclina VS20]|uniref:RNI-like protein n=1 Tax=Saprolegnia diclina (strain VS20) TaxID=1156394 RepID=T0RKA9_SAPDV|nr:hypothetical protein SDRG_09720 [Saprolegnia diclina VS20]EQC32748.1 hypothetical protein SDRG_09720 [Saprolegnia diclina VS20]|eukprot:XP_008613892.1 hypothetical protein SDRG_09720 [Saprolegnia diclina VS20]